ncbi:MAG: hypothetical protein UIB39_02305 [Lachnospiraceae bacterium]|nr:hypothetical protein [Lachnospiraceae bacterium]
MKNEKRKRTKMKTSGMKMQMSEEAGQSGMRPGDKENKTGTQKEEGDIFRIEKGRPAAQGSGVVWVETDHKRSILEEALE